MKPFKSHSCPYSVQYPSSYQVTAGKVTGTADIFKSGVTTISISCSKSANTLPLATVVSSSAASLKKSGYKVTVAKTKGGLGEIAYNKGAVSFILALQLSKGYLFQYVLGDTKANLSKSQKVFFSMLNSIKIS
jgi:hypothetical protein